MSFGCGVLEEVLYLVGTDNETVLPGVGAVHGYGSREVSHRSGPYMF